YRWALITPDRGLLLERHREVCRDFAATGARSVANLPAEQVNQCQQAVDSRSHRRRHRFQGLNTMAGSLVTLCAGLALIRPLADDAPFLFPVTILAWGLLWPALHAFQFRAAAAASRAEDARQANRPAPRRAGGRAS